MKALILCVCAWICIGQSLFANMFVVDPQAEDGSSQVMLVCSGKAAYPYPIQTDVINRLMGRRLAIFDAFGPLREHLSWLESQNISKKMPKVSDNGFVEQVIVLNHVYEQDLAHVRLLIRLPISYEQLKSLNMPKDNPLKIEERPGMVADIFNDQELYLTEEFWINLLQFERAFSDEDE